MSDHGRIFRAGDWCNGYEIVRPWMVKILDLGAAKFRHFLAAVSTDPGRGPWTPGYAAPEQIEGSPDIDRRADIFSLGVMMYEMLSGIHPFAQGATSQTMVVERQLAGRTRPLTELGIAKEMAAIVHRAMARHPEDRYQSMEELLEPLRKAITAYAARCDQVASPKGPSPLRRRAKVRRWATDEIATSPPPLDEAPAIPRASPNLLSTATPF